MMSETTMMTNYDLHHNHKRWFDKTNFFVSDQKHRNSNDELRCFDFVLIKWIEMAVASGTVIVSFCWQR